MRNGKTEIVETEKLNSNGYNHTSVPNPDELDSETSFPAEHIRIFDRIGIKIDDMLHDVFTK